MIKNAIIYRIAAGWLADLQALEAALARTPFIECTASQEKSSGWVPPRGDANGALVESIGGQWMLRFMTEAKLLPADVLNRKLQQKCEAVEREHGRKPGKKEKKELKEEARLDMLPNCHTKQGSCWVWIDPTARQLVLDVGNQARADEIVSILVEALPGFGVALLDTQTSPQAAMAHWLTSQEGPAGFSIDRECELKAADESKAVVRYARHPLDIEEVKVHVEHGKLPTKLALTWDDRVSFVLTDALQLKKITFLDAVLDQAGEEGGFDTDVAIATGELVKLLPDLVEALGGERRTELGRTEPAAQQPSHTGPASAPVDTNPGAAPF